MSLNTKKIVDFFEANVKTGRQHYEKMGGIRLESRLIFFPASIFHPFHSQLFITPYHNHQKIKRHKHTLFYKKIMCVPSTQGVIKKCKWMAL